MNLDLSIILPCYNEGDIIRENLNKITKFINNNLKEIYYEIIVVNDGSKDMTKRLLNKLDNWIDKSNKFKGVNVINYQPNRGKGYAIKCGLEQAEGDYILFMDTDLSTSLNEIIKFWNHKEKADIIIGNRKLNDSVIKNKSLKRKIISFACNLITKIIVPINYKDTQCGFKFFKKEIAKEFAKKQTIEKFAFDVEYLYIAKLKKYSVLELPVKWDDRRESKIKLSSSSIKFFKDLFKIRFNRIKYIK